MEHHEKNFENVLRLALVKERMHSYSPQRGHGTGKTHEIKGMRALLFFALADYTSHPGIRDILGVGNFQLLRTNLYSTVVTEKAGISEIRWAISKAISGGAEPVFEQLNHWIEVYSAVLDVIPTMYRYMESAELKYVNDPRLSPGEVAMIKSLGLLMDQKEPDRFARFVDNNLREDPQLKHYLMAGFPASMSGYDILKVVGRPITSDHLQAFVDITNKIQTFLKMYQRIAVQATPPAAPQRTRYRH